MSISLAPRTWRASVTLPEVAVLLTLLGLFWILAGLAGVLGWVVVAAALVVTPPVVAVAVGQLLLVTLPDAAPPVGVATTQTALVALLLIDGVTVGWTRLESSAFVVLAGLLGGGVLLLVPQTNLLIAGLFLLGVLGAGAIGLSEFIPSPHFEEAPGGSE